VTTANTLDVDDVLEMIKALGNPTRLQIMGWLREPDVNFADFEPIADRQTVGVCVTHLQAKAKLAQSTMSGYMSTLEQAGLVTSTRVGKWTHYRRNENQVALLAQAIETLI
jgi:DNA-binding transcriptional ArsR family regulator